MLSVIDKVRLMGTSKGFYACVKRQLEWHKVKITKENKGYWNFIQCFYKSTILLENFMLNRFKLLLKHGIEKNNLQSYSVSEEMLSVFIYYLSMRNKKYLQRLMHTVVPHLDPVTRRCFRRLVIRIELYLRRQKQLPIKAREKKQTKQMNKVMNKMSRSSVSKDISVQNQPLHAGDQTQIFELTEANLSEHNKRKYTSSSSSNKRHKQAPNRYQPDTTNLKDDLSASEVEDNDNIPMEERSVDSGSAGSLKDFVVDDEEEEQVESSVHEEEELSDRETEDSQSFHSSALTDSEEI